MSRRMLHTSCCTKPIDSAAVATIADAVVKQLEKCMHAAETPALMKTPLDLLVAVQKEKFDATNVRSSRTVMERISDSLAGTLWSAHLPKEFVAVHSRTTTMLLRGKHVHG